MEKFQGLFTKQPAPKTSEQETQEYARKIPQMFVDNLNRNLLAEAEQEKKAQGKK
jgi:hypothetical protein